MHSGHGGNIQEVCALYGLEPGNLLDFSANINPLGYPPTLSKILNEGLSLILHYPDINCTNLRRTIARKIRHKEEEILLGNGSTEHIYLLPRAFRPARGLVFDPTYSDYVRALTLVGASVERLISSEKTSFKSDLKNVVLTEERFNIIFLCNPNNPTGNLVEKEEILHLAEVQSQCLIVVDEAFMDFVEDAQKYSVLPEAGRVKNLIILRSMTKFFGYPGLRLGYMVAHPEVINQLYEHKEPWTVNALAQLAGEAALKDEDFVFKSREYVVSEKQFLYKSLSQMGGVSPSQPTVNFITSKITHDGLSSGELKEALIRKGFLIRDCSNFPGLSNKYFRIAVRRREENLLLLQALDAVLKERVV